MKRSVAIASLALLAAGAPSALAHGEAFAVNLRGTVNLRQFPANDPSQIGTIVGPTINTFAMDFNTAGTALYAIRNTATDVWDLGTIDTTNGNFSATAPISGLTGNATGLSVDPTTETFYVSNASTLFTLNPVTGALTTIGAFGGNSGTMIDIAIDNNGNMFGHSISTDALYSIDKTTGAATLIGETGYNANFAQGMDFDPVTNILYAAIYVGAGVGHYVSLDTSTGVATLIADTLPFNVEMEMAIRVPGPASIALLGLAGVAATRRRR